MRSINVMCSAAVSKVIASAELPQANDAIAGFSIVRSPAQGVARIRRVGDEATTDQHSYNIVDQPGLGPLESDLDSFTH